MLFNVSVFIWIFLESLLQTWQADYISPDTHYHLTPITQAQMELCDCDNRYELCDNGDKTVIVYDKWTDNVEYIDCYLND